MNLLPTPSLATLGMALAFVALGVLLGALHFASLRWNSRLFVTGASVWQPVLLQLLRLGVTAAGLLACARAGTLPLLAALAGLLLARQWLLRRGEAG